MGERVGQSRVLVGTAFAAGAVTLLALWRCATWAERLPQPIPPWIVGIAVTGAVLNLVAISLILINLRRRTEAFIDAARRWAGGEMTFRLSERNQGVPDGLATALNQMAATLHRREETSRLHAEELAIQSEKLATTGRLAAGVAHEINNPLGGILLFGNLLLEGMADDDPQRKTVKKIVDQAARAKQIVVGLLDFARERPPHLARQDLNRIVRDVLGLLERQPRLQLMQLRVELSTVPLLVEVDSAKIEQVLVNILLNGIDAMRDGGQLTIRSGFSERDGFCRIAISDTGCGIREEDMPHIFEPFFTTKEVGDGVGLGLAISYGIVKQHRGEIEVQSRLGAGTTFRVILPLVEVS